MTTTYKKKLIEVAIPLEAINAASIKEKGNPFLKGHPRALHQWWARRPLPACRAVLFSQLVDDPSSHPEQFPTNEDQERERQRLFVIIEDLVKWENSTNEEVLGRARAEILRSCGGALPTVYDPFSGGGAIPFEAQRLGLPAYGSDLNPVAVMIGKAMIEIPPKFKDMPPSHPGIRERSFYRNTEGLAEDVRHYGEWMRQKAWERIGHLYPQVKLPKEFGGGNATVIAWIWVRTVPSPNPAFSDVHVPIASSFLLSAKSGKEAWIEPIVDRQNKTITYCIRQGGNKAELAKAKEGTKAGRGANFSCLISETAITPDYVKKLGRDGKLGVALMAVVAEGNRGRIYIEPSQEQENVAKSAVPVWSSETKLPNDPRNFWTVDYGIDTFGKLFTNRQLVSLNTFSDLVAEVRQEIETNAAKSATATDNYPLRDGGLGARAYSEAVSLYLGFAVNKLATYGNAHCRWNPINENTAQIFGRQSIPMLWDFNEGNPFGPMLDFNSQVLSIALAISEFCPNAYGELKHCDAADATSPANGVVISSDPPYYDNIGYSDLSDFYYVWLRRHTQDIFPEVFSTISTPKSQELIAAPYRHGGKEEAERFFLNGMRAALSNISSIDSGLAPAAIYYAFKQSEVDDDKIFSTGWSTFLEAVIQAGYIVVGTWPIRTERNTGLKLGTNVLANSVVLVCRKKDASAEIITRAEFIRSLKRELPSAIKELQAANIAPADMPQSAIGPGMGVFSRYKAVLESDDSSMSVKAALQLINRELDEYLGGIQGEFDPDTRFAITWFEQNGNKAGDYGTANNIAQARGISVESVKHAGIVESSAGKVRILTRDELDPDWQPEDDTHLTVWECCQHLVRLHEKNGIGLATAVMIRKIGAKADDVRDLVYVLYNICEKRGDAKEATSYNALIADWTDLTREAASAPLTTKSGQMRFEV